MGNTLVNVLRKWWVILLIGLFSLVLGLVLIANPGTGFEIARTIVVADYLILAAAAIAVTAARRSEVPAWGWNLAGAVALFVLGIIAAATPGVSESVLIALFIFGFLIEGISGIYASLLLKRVYASGWGWSMAFSVLTVLIGLMLVFNPIVAALSIDMLVAVAMLSFGVSTVIIAYRLSKINGSLNMAIRDAEARRDRVVRAAKQAADRIEKAAETQDEQP